MKKLLIALALFAFAPVLPAQESASADRESLVQYLEKTRKELLVATKGLSEQQWNFKPATNRWSVAEIVEHIAAAEDMIFETVRDKVMATPAISPSADFKADDEFILKNVPDRTSKFPAPEPLIPSKRFGSSQDSLKHFEASRAKTLSFAKETKGLREHAMDSPLGKKFDAHQWLLFLGAHSERHTKQLNEVKADPGFPKN
jgi:Protein of unknown function (DUF664).